MRSLDADADDDGSNCIHRGRQAVANPPASSQPARRRRRGANEQSNLRFVVIFLRLWDAVYTT